MYNDNEDLLYIKFGIILCQIVFFKAEKIVYLCTLKKLNGKKYYNNGCNKGKF